MMSTTETKLIVNVEKLLENPGSRKDLAFSEAVPDLRLDCAWVPEDAPLGFSISVEALDGGIVVRGPVTGRFVEACRRCLEEQERELRFELAEVYRPRSDEWEEGYVIEGETVDLNLAVRDNVMTVLPLYPTCREDCKGLCPSCGVNRNEVECSCAPEEGDLRWTQLKDLLEGGDG